MKLQSNGGDLGEGSTILALRNFKGASSITGASSTSTATSGKLGTYNVAGDDSTEARSVAEIGKASN